MRALKIVLAGAATLGLVSITITMSANSTALPDDTALTDQQRQDIVSHFASAIVHDDHPGIAASTTPDITWTIPGTSSISGQTSGQTAVMNLADILSRHELHITVRGYTFGRDTVAVELHDTGNHDGVTLDQDVVNVLTIRDGKIASVTANFADVASFDAYFA